MGGEWTMVRGLVMVGSKYLGEACKKRRKHTRGETETQTEPFQTAGRGLASARPLALQRRPPAGINGNGRDARGAFLGKTRSTTANTKSSVGSEREKEQKTTTAGEGEEQGGETRVASLFTNGI